MLLIKVWCLPANQSEEALQALHKSIVAAAVGISELDLKGQNDMTCLFPPDMMKYGLGDEITVEVTNLSGKLESTGDVRQRLAKSLGESVHFHYPQAKVDCIVNQALDPRGFWSSEP